MTWKILEGHAEKEAMKKIMDDQQESLNKWKSKGGHYFFLLIIGYFTSSLLEKNLSFQHA